MSISRHISLPTNHCQLTSKPQLHAPNNPQTQQRQIPPFSQWSYPESEHTTITWCHTPNKLIGSSLQALPQVIVQAQIKTLGNKKKERFGHSPLLSTSFHLGCFINPWHPNLKSNFMLALELHSKLAFFFYIFALNFVSLICRFFFPCTGTPVQILSKLKPSLPFCHEIWYHLVNFETSKKAKADTFLTTISNASIQVWQ